MTKRRKRIISEILIIFFTGFFFLQSQTAYAKISDDYQEYDNEYSTLIGWVNTAVGWTFYDASGKQVKGTWVNDNGNWYYLRADGIMATSWLNEGGNWYYLYSNGCMAKNTTINGYYLNSSGAWSQNNSMSTENVFSYIGLTKNDILNKFGQYDYIGDYEESEYWEYNNSPIVFLFTNDGKVMCLIAYKGANINGAIVGMTFSEIKSILGEPTREGVKHWGGSNPLKHDEINGYNTNQKVYQMSYDEVNGYNVIFESAGPEDKYTVRAYIAKHLYW